MIGRLAVVVLRRRRRTALAAAVAVVSLGAVGGPLAPRPAVAAGVTRTGAVAVAATPDGGGYWIAASYGTVVPLGDAAGLTGVSGSLNQPIVGIAPTPTGQGYWLAAADGGIFPQGDAAGYGSTGAMTLNKPIVGIAATPRGRGYWLVAADGGIFPFGDAQGYGSTGSMRLNRPIVGIAATPDGRGYWLVASDGGIFPFGDAAGYGSTGGMTLNRPIVGIAGTPDGRGYWLVASDGGIFPFGDAAGFGSAGGVELHAPMAAIAATPGGRGYWLVAADGGVFPYGDARGAGSAVGRIRWGGRDVVSRPECGVPAGAVTAGKVLVLSLSCQEMTAYQDGVNVYDTDITTGRPALPTPPGQYSVLRKVAPWRMVSDWPRSSPYWYPPTWVQYTLWFRDGGYAIHDAPWRSAYGPGTESNGSHGCVNVPMPIMADLYRWAEVGIPVRIY